MIRRRAFLIGSGGTAVITLVSGLLSAPARAATGNIVTARALRSVNSYRKANGRGALRSDGDVPFSVEKGTGSVAVS
ncbi:hypothetical protein [Nitratireductor sp. XY-223]|uniref:hypothetical protein n=1 Tax=Nitratireductor sp. XY-223 TaxID=2561926 RepID=UPI0010A9FD59|nr:hypothetical protein [Nitratireductor sp. XY-223]